jgi:hypothetical protein
MYKIITDYDVRIEGPNWPETNETKIYSSPSQMIEFLFNVERGDDFSGAEPQKKLISICVDYLFLYNFIAKLAHEEKDFGKYRCAKNWSYYINNADVVLTSFQLGKVWKEREKKKIFPTATQPTVYHNVILTDPKNFPTATQPTAYHNVILTDPEYERLWGDEYPMLDESDVEEDKEQEEEEDAEIEAQEEAAQEAVVDNDGEEEDLYADYYDSDQLEDSELEPAEDD